MPCGSHLLYEFIAENKQTALIPLFCDLKTFFLYPNQPQSSIIYLKNVGETALKKFVWFYCCKTYTSKLQSKFETSSSLLVDVL